MARKFYVRCAEADGDDYVYQVCDTIEEARKVVQNQNPDDAPYEHLYIVEHEIPDVHGDEEDEDEESKKSASKPDSGKKPDEDKGDAEEDDDKKSEKKKLPFQQAALMYSKRAVSDSFLSKVSEKPKVDMTPVAQLHKRLSLLSH